MILHRRFGKRAELTGSRGRSNLMNLHRPRIHALFLFVLLTAGLAPRMAGAETACIALDGTEFWASGESTAGKAVGSLEKRQCFAVSGRTDGWATLWIPEESGFSGGVVVPESALAHVLVGDVELKDGSGEPWGKVLSGAVVAIESEHADGLRVVTAEGRARIRFELSYDDLFPASSWPSPDPEVSPDKGWPSAEEALPQAAQQFVGPSGDVRVELLPILLDVEDILLDPDQGRLRLQAISTDSSDNQIRLVGPSAWVEGRPIDSDWLESGADVRQASAPSVRNEKPELDRQVGSKGAELFTAPKGARVGQFVPGHWLSVIETQGPWLQVVAPISGGSVAGWIEKKRLVSVKKTGPVPGSKDSSAYSLFRLGQTAVQWSEPEAHEGEEVPPLELTPLTERLSRGTEPLRLSYAEALSSSPAQAGEITLRLLVSPDGSLESTHVAVDTLGSPVVVEALMSHLGGLTFSARKLSRSQRRSKESQALEVWVQLLFTSGTP
jgi:hypothetical protein